MAKNPKRPRDPNQLGKLIVQIATGESDNDKPNKPDSAKRRGGLRGAKSRTLSLSPERRKEIAEKAVKKRWDKT